MSKNYSHKLFYTVICGEQSYWYYKPIQPKVKPQFIYSPLKLSESNKKKLSTLPGVRLASSSSSIPKMNSKTSYF